MLLSDRVRQVIANAFGVDVPGVRPEAGLGTVEGWDSMGHVALMAELERAFHINIALDEAVNLTTVERICRCLESKNIRDGG